MSDDDFNELVKRKFAELERKNGRVPTLQELANTLDIDSRMLARKLRKAIQTLGIDNYTEGTSAFKSTLRQYLSGDILTKGSPGFADLSALHLELKTKQVPYNELRWKSDQIEYKLIVSSNSQSDSLWALFSSVEGIVFERITKDIGDIASLLQSVSRNEEIDKQLISHVSGEPVAVVMKELPVHEYQDPIAEDLLPPNVLPFRKPYRHPDE